MYVPIILLFLIVYLWGYKNGVKDEKKNSNDKIWRMESILKAKSGKFDKEDIQHL